MNSTSKHPIGIFDSGIGGTSIWKEINTQLPNENTIYLSDSKNAPYGQKSEKKILELSIKNTELLLEKNCKAIVVACNTATTNAIKYLREKYSIPFIGIEPAIKPASINTKTKNIGILATKGTLNSNLFSNTSKEINQEVTVFEQIGEGLVELIESGQLFSKEMTALLTNHLQKLTQHNIDFEEAASAILYVLQNYDNVRFRLIGPLKLSEKFAHYESKIEKIPFCDYKQYLSFLAECDISIAPLEKTSFNDAKSNIKFIEASIVKIPSVCSHREAFRKAIIHGENGFLCETQEDFKDILELLIKNPAMRKQIGESAYTSVIENYYPDGIANRQILPLIKKFKKNLNPDE